MTTRLHLERSHVTSSARRGFELFARAGFAAQGVLYATIGALAALAAFGAGGRTTDSKGALRELGRQPFGETLLVITAVGLAGYALFLFVQAIRDPGREASQGFKGVAKRLGWFVTALIHGGLVAYAINLLRGSATQGDGARGWSARLLAWEPFGPWIVAGVGAIVLGYGIREVVCGVRAHIDQRIALGELAIETRRRVLAVSRFGMVARGIVFFLVGAFAIVSAARHDPNEAKGLGDALATLRAAPYGTAVLAVVACGLVAYAAYDWVRARYRVIPDPAAR